MRSHLISVFAAGLALGLCTAAPAAHASSSYPGAMKNHLSAASVQGCTVCHASNAGGFGTVDKPFGEAMMAAGLTAADEASLTAALDQLNTDGTDSDADTISDIDELVAGSDPNDAASTPDTIDGGNGNSETLSYGFCGAAPMPIFFALGALLVRRRRR